VAERRAAAYALVYGGNGYQRRPGAAAAMSRPPFPEQRRHYPTGQRRATTGVDAIDLWIGGLAEKQTPFGGLLGSTFNFVFENQMENLQNGDRFYYLERTAGLNFNHELETTASPS
jgi:hypothetical protein